MATVLCVLYDDPVDGYPTKYARDGLPVMERYPDGQTLPTPESIDFTPGELVEQSRRLAALVEDTAERLQQLDVGQLDVGQLDVGQLDVGQLDVGQLGIRQLDVGQLDVGQLGI